MKFNFIGRRFIYSLLVITLLEAVSYTALFYPDLNKIAFVVIVAAVFFLTIWKTEFGIYFVLAELIIGSKGYLFSLEYSGISISIRLAMFLAIFTAWFLKSIFTKKERFGNFSLIKWYGILLSFVVLGIMVGYYNGNPLKDIFYDMNGWLYFALLPVFLVSIRDHKSVQNLLQVIFASALSMISKTIVLLFIFSHQIQFIMPTLYKWVRDTGVGEITKMDNNFYRIFFQSHIYAVIIFFIIAYIVINVSRKNFTRSSYCLHILIGFFSALVTFISYSRSFWLGGLVGIVFLMYAILFIIKLTMKKSFEIGVVMFAVFAVVYVSTLAIVKFPWPNPSSFTGGLIEERTKDVTEEAASASRFKLLVPLFDKIKENPILGSGFGTSVTYETSDPRALAANPDGLYTTYSFEWGYLDTWIETGIFGLLAYLILLVSIYRFGLKVLRKYDIQSYEASLVIGLLTGLVVLSAVNATTPYLNHPLGIAYLLLVTAILTALNQTQLSGIDKNVQ